jgi:hypothetical protein
MGVALLVQPTLRAQAQAEAQAKPPAVVISLASYDKMMADLRYGGDVAGASQYIGLLQFFAGAYTQAIDTTRPGGVLIDFDGPMPVATAFLPVKSLQRLLDQVADQVGPARDIGDGVKQLDGPQPLFAKESGGFAFITNSPDNLTNLPADPVALLGGANTQYDLAVTINVQSVPQQLRDMAIEQIREGFDSQMEMQRLLEEGDELDREMQERLGRNAVDSMVKLVQQSDQINLGWAIDSTTQSTYLDFSMTALEGTDLAGQMALLGESRTNFAGLLTPAAVNINLAGQMSADDKQQANDTLEVLLAKGQQELDEDEDITEDARAAAKRMLTAFGDIAKATIQEGIVDAGAMLTTHADSLQVLAGIHVADGMEVEKAVKTLVELARQEPNFPDVNLQLDALQHNGVNFHTASLPVPDENARRVFGETLDLVLGTGAKSVYFAFGPGSIDLLKEAIDKSVQEPKKSTLPTRISVAMTPLLRFGAQLEPDNETLRDMLAAVERSQGKDQVVVTAQAIPRGVTYRLDIQEGVLRMIGSAVTAGMQEDEF